MISLELKEYKKYQPFYSKFGEFIVDATKQLKQHGYPEDIQLQMNKERFDNLSVRAKKWIKPKFSSFILTETNLLAVYGFRSNSSGRIMSGLMLLINEVWEEEF